MTNAFERVANFYNERTRQYGHDWRSCAYGSAKSQTTRFASLAQVLPLHNKKILDVGCGFADFADYLEAKDIRVDYTGYDLSEEMIKLARQRRPDLVLEQRNILLTPPPDFEIQCRFCQWHFRFLC